MSAFVCRDEAVAAVRGAVQRPPALVLVEGEAGIGKTRLVQECLWGGSLPDRPVLMMVCPPSAGMSSLGPVVDGLRRLREQISGVPLSPLAGALRPLFPEWAADLPPTPEPLEDAAARRHRVFRALVELTGRLGVDVLVLEDAHWADAASLQWLLSSIASGDHGWSVVVTYRPQDVPPASLLWQLTSRMPSGMAQVRVELDPLDAAGIAQLTRSMFGVEEVSTEFATFLHERTGGLPLAVEESLRLLRDRGDITRTGDQWARRELVELRVPPTVRDSVLERAQRLEPDTRRILEAAAVLGEPAGERLLAKVAGLAPQAAGHAVAAGCKTGLLGGAGSGRVEFRHQLAAEAVEDSIPDTHRRRLHQRAGKALQAAGDPSVARLSKHFKEAGDVESWAYYAEASADAAVAAGSDYTAVSVLYELLTMVDHPGPRRGRLARKLGEAAESATAAMGERADHVAHVLREVLASSDIPAGDRGSIRLLLGQLLRWLGQMDVAYDEIEAAVPDLVDRPVLAYRAMVILGMPLAHGWPVGRHLRWIERAVARAPRAQSLAERLSMRINQATALLLLGEEVGWQVADEVRRDESSQSERRMLARGHVNIGQLAITWGRHAEARTRLDSAIELLEATGDRRVLNIARVALVHLDWCTGAWQGLGQAAARLAEAEQTEPVTVRLHARQIQGLVELASGARAAAEQRLREVAGELATRGLVEPEAAGPGAALGRIYLADGATDKALQITEQAMATILGKGLWLWAADIAPVYVDALVATGQLGLAEDLARRFAHWCTGHDAAAPRAASMLCQAIMCQAGGQSSQAAQLFAQAAGAWAALPRPYDELLALERQGRCLFTGEPDKAVAVLSPVRSRLQQLGALWDADRVAQLLREHGVEAPRPWRRGPHGYGGQLSPREREVVTLVAQGMTNREIGRVLFLSPRTVASHVSRAIHKLGVTTRTAAAMAAAEAGLIPANPEH